MTANIAQAAPPRGLNWQAARLPASATWLAALAVIAAKAWLTTGQGLTHSLGDMDDAARLIQVRELMAGAPWFDTSTMTMGGAGGMLSHWSRLIDLPIAILLMLCQLVMPAEIAEITVRAVWPMITLAPLIYVVHRTAGATAGPQAGSMALLLVILLPLGLYQFDAGRIDHHNVMIATSVSAALLVFAHAQSAKHWAIAGGLSGLAIAIGYEALAPVAAIAVFVALWGLLNSAAARPARAFVLTLAATFAAAFLMTMPPSRWMDVRCDAISLNLVALLAAGGGGLSYVLSRHARWPLMMRLAITGCAALLGVALFGLLEPKCLAGPMGQLPKVLNSIWLDHVSESRSIFVDLLQGRIEQSLGLIAFFAAGIAAQLSRLWKTRDHADLFLLAAQTTCVALACWQYKYVAYASFLTVVPLALWISRLEGFAGISAVTTRCAAVVLLSQAALLGASGTLEKTFDTPRILPADRRASAEDCLKTEAIRDLATLPPGLIAARIDLGAYIAALTPHHVLSAPYHRIADAIIANYNLFGAKSEGEAAKIIAREHIDYVVTCEGLDNRFVTSGEWDGTLRADLTSGTAPKFLAPVALVNPQSLFRVWRVDRNQMDRTAEINPQP